MKIENLEHLLNVVDEFGFEPIELYLYYQLTWINDFQCLSNEDKELYLKNCFEDFNTTSITLEKILDIAEDDFEYYLNK